MKKILLSILMFYSIHSVHAQILDTLRIDTCFNIGFQKNQIDIYYLEEKGDDIILMKETIIEGLKGFPFQKSSQFFSVNFKKTDKTSEFKAGDMDTMTFVKFDGNVNYLKIREFYIESWSEDVVFRTRYVTPNGENYFYDYHPNGQAFRKVLLDSSGRMIGEVSNCQIDSFALSFTQLDKMGNVVVYQRGSKESSQHLMNHSNELVFVKYKNGKFAYKENKVNDSTRHKQLYSKDGELKILLILTYEEKEDKEHSTPEEPVWIAVVKIKRIYFEDGKAIEVESE